MSKEYSQQQITRFFQQFKQLESSITIEKVHQIINNPNAMARYRVKHVKPLKIIIMTFLISLSAVLAFWFSAPDTQKNINPEQDLPVNKQEVAITENRDQSDVKASDVKMATATEINQDENVNPTESVDNSAQQPVVEKQKELVQTDSVIDGSRFILELTNEELAKLGFQINHYSVYYRNHNKDQKVFYLATHKNGLFSVRGEGVFFNMKDYYPLQIDTIPEFVSIKQLRIIERGQGIKPQDRIRNDVEYQSTYNSFYPYFCGNQQGEVEKLAADLNFDEVADTLMPVVIKYSQLDLEKKQDQFFWFYTNNEFYSTLPERYSWVKEEFEALKEVKRHKGNQFNVDYKINDWHKELLIPNGMVLNGQNCIVQFTKAELEKVGVFKKENNRWFYNHKTPYKGTAGGLIFEEINGVNDFKYDTTFNVDYYAQYTTNCTGDFLANQSTIKRMDEFFNDDDILLPVQAENKEGTIYWFTLSENFWKLVPARYQYLKTHYEKMLYNKSIIPNRDFATYFKEPFKKIGVNVSIIDLAKEELEYLGFKFIDGGSEINCGFGKNWIKYWFTDKFNRESEKSSIKTPKRQPFEFLQYFAPSKEYPIPEVVEKYDSLYAASKQGYQFVYITDSLGRHTRRINIPRKDLQINGEDFKYLIPVMVRFSKVTNPLAEDRVFWFTPTETFFDRLPDRIKNELRKEYEIVSSEGKSAELSACTYFETCRSTLKVENMKIYPNPAKREITIDFSLMNAQSGEILLANIMGQQVKVLRPKSTFNEGANSVICELNGIKPGIYLVSIVTPMGFKTERLIVAE
jgi:hypothetical protein